jgi:hypothetical protein
MLLNVDISFTTGPTHTGFVAYKRKFSWSHFSITILCAGKSQNYDNLKYLCNYSMDFEKTLTKFLETKIPK